MYDQLVPGLIFRVNCIQSWHPKINEVFTQTARACAGLSHLSFTISANIAYLL